MDRQGKHPVGQMIGNGALVGCSVKIIERRLAVHRYGIVNSRRDVLGFQGFLQLGTNFLIGKLDGILRPTGIEALGYLRSLHHAAKQLGITGGDLVHFLKFMVSKGFQLH